MAEKEKQKVAVIVDSVTKKAGEIATVKDDAERDLAAAKPALDAALNALNSISPKVRCGGTVWEVGSGVGEGGGGWGL